MLRRLIDRLFGGKETPAPPASQPSTPPVLRNKPNSMAWIKGIRESLPGASQLNNRAVKTVCLSGRGNWVIDPPQFFIATETFVWDDMLYLKGDPVGVSGIADECLEPWKEDGVSDKEVSDLYAPVKQQGEPTVRRIPVYTVDNLPRGPK